MLMGVDVEGISVIIFVRVMNMMHYILQGKSSNENQEIMRRNKNNDQFRTFK